MRHFTDSDLRALRNLITKGELYCGELGSPRRFEVRGILTWNHRRQLQVTFIDFSRVKVWREVASELFTDYTGGRVI